MSRDVTFTVTLPARMLSAMTDLAEGTYGVTAEQFAVMMLARSMRKPRGPAVDVSRDWAIYDQWRRGTSTRQIADGLGIARQTVTVRLQAMGLKPHADWTSRSAKAAATKRARGDLSGISKRGWETRRAQQTASEEP